MRRPTGLAPCPMWRSVLMRRGQSQTRRRRCLPAFEPVRADPCAASQADSPSRIFVQAAWRGWPLHGAGLARARRFVHGLDGRESLAWDWVSSGPVGLISWSPGE